MDKSTDIRTGRHCVYTLHAHLVFVTKYRQKVLTAEALGVLKGLFEKICLGFEAILVEFDGEDDHVHLMIEYPPKYALSKIVNSMKGASSRVLKKQCPDVADRYYKGALWSPSYFAGSVGGAPLSILKQYIKNQRTPK